MTIKRKKRRLPPLPPPTAEELRTIQRRKEGATYQRMPPYDALPKEVREKIQNTPFGCSPQHVDELLYLHEQGFGVNYLCSKIQDWQDKGRAILIKKGVIVDVTRQA